MQLEWRELVDRGLRPVRPGLARCLREQEAHKAAQSRVAEQRARAIALCEARITHARSAVFAADDGVVTRLMTDLEREWRSLSRVDHDGAMMELWARVAPAAWIDRKRWRGADGDVQTDVAIALAADVTGVEAAEAAVGALCDALAPWTRIGRTIRWRPLVTGGTSARALFEAPLRQAEEQARRHEYFDVAAERAQRARDDVRAYARAALPEPLADDVAHLVYVDAIARVAGDAALGRAVAALAEVLRTGYVVGAFDDATVTLELPSLERDGVVPRPD